MKDQNFNKSGRKPRILVAPLDWGLGHAVRCIPIIRELFAICCEPLIAAGGPSKAILEKEFPGALFIDIPVYNIRYSRKNNRLAGKILAQMPKVFLTISKEKRWLKKIIREHRIDGVISDNRPGLHHPGLPCIYITHQLEIKTRNRITDRMVQKIHYHFINKFLECWVPDMDGGINLAGELAHPKKMPAIPVRYIGPISRFNKVDVEIKYALAIILSGPEPQRTVFEDLLLEQLVHYKEPVLFVRGLPNDPAQKIFNQKNIEIHNSLTAEELNTGIESAAMVICRSGYTSIMDLVKLGHKAILVPTPGQTEQEYLAAEAARKKIFLSASQDDFKLIKILEEAAVFPFVSVTMNFNGYKKAAGDLISGLINT